MNVFDKIEQASRKGLGVKLTWKELSYLLERLAEEGDAFNAAQAKIENAREDLADTERSIA